VEWVGQVRDLLARRSDRLDATVIETQPVEQRVARPFLRFRGHVHLVRVHDGATACPQMAGDGAQGVIPVTLGEGALRDTRACEEGGESRGSVAHAARIA